jgi:hypothetical protein
MEDGANTSGTGSTPEEDQSFVEPADVTGQPAGVEPADHVEPTAPVEPPVPASTVAPGESGVGTTNDLL